MAVDQRRQRTVGVQPVAVDGGVPRRGQDLDVFEAGRHHPLGAPLRRRGDVAVVDGLGADRRDPHPAGQGVEQRIALGGEEIAQDGTRGDGAGGPGGSGVSPEIEHGP